MDVGTRISQIRQVEAKIKEIETRHKEELKPYEALAEQMRNKVLAFLNETNQQNAKTKEGTAYKYERISYRVEDPDQFKRHIIGAEEWDAINWSVSKTAADDLFTRTKQLYPGVTRSVMVTLGVLAPPKPKAKREKQETGLTEEELAELDTALDAKAAE
jgi:hypothetical protein